METQLRKDAETILRSAIRQVLPDAAVIQALKNRKFLPGRLYVVAAGKAAWQMARTARDTLGERITAGVVVTKYGHGKGKIPGMTCFEAGHPVPDGNTLAAAQAAVELVQGLKETDTVLFLLSGGGSALFELPMISLEELADVTGQLLACGAEITEINTIRKRLSGVKGGKFAELCAPARVFNVILSDILGDPVDMIASGPTCADTSTCAQAVQIAEKYGLKLSPRAEELLRQETPKSLSNVETVVTGSVTNLCRAAMKAAEQLGYAPVLLTDRLCCEAREAGAFLGAIARTHRDPERDMAWIAGGETVVHLTGHGLGGRNQELALAAAEALDGLDNAAVFSVGSDGTDGPTDAAGGYADGRTADRLRRQGIDVFSMLRENDSYHALEKTGGLIRTGATGTNVNDVSVVLIRRKKP